MIRKIKNTVPWTCVTEVLNSKEIVEMFYENELQKTNQTDFRIDKVIKKKADKSCVKWKCYDDFLDSWIDKKNIII